MKNNKGFALIELFIALAILGILVSVTVPAYKEYKCRASGYVIQGTACSKVEARDKKNRPEEYRKNLGNRKTSDSYTSSYKADLEEEKTPPVSRTPYADALKSNMFRKDCILNAPAGVNPHEWAEMCTEQAEEMYP